MGERSELLNDIQKLKMERNRILEQIKEAEQWESVAWDSYHALELYQYEGFAEWFLKRKLGFWGKLSFAVLLWILSMIRITVCIENGN